MPYILHRSLLSPYAEIAQLMLGYCGQPWQSLIAPKGLPRPVQEKLVAGYARRIPILQLGADLFCDTDMIAAELADAHDKPELLSTRLCHKDLQLLEQIEGPLFAQLIGALSPLQMLWAYFKRLPVADTWHFVQDRRQLAKQLTAERPPRQRCIAQVQSYFDELEQRLQQSCFLSAGDEPNYLDFSAFTMVYYHQLVNSLSLAKRCKKLKHWFSTMAAIAYGQREEIKPGHALALAASNEPRSVPAHMVLPSAEKVTVKSSDVLAEVTEGVVGHLVAENQYKYILKREQAELGSLHLHLPKKRFRII